MYIAIDGDSVGTRLQQYILEERLDELKQFSESIKNTLSRFCRFLEDQGGVVYMSGGDNLFGRCTEEGVLAMAEYVEQENKKQQICYSLAAGDSTQDVYLGLNYAKCSRIHYIRVDRDKEKVTFRNIRQQQH